MSPRSPGRPFLAPVEQWRIRYAKRGRLRFASHRDLQRSFERALRRAGVPMAYSAGFRPHPRISYAGAVPTGTASEAEYLEIGVVERIDRAALAESLDQALPAGFDILEAERAISADFAKRLEASVWRVEVAGLVDEDLGRAARAFMAQDEIVVERVTKSGRRGIDVRQRVSEMVALCASGRDATYAILEFVLAHGTPSARANDVLGAMWRVAGVVPPPPPRMTRTAQGPIIPGPGRVGDPLALDRAGSPPAAT